MTAIRQVADVSLPTRWAHFRMMGFEYLAEHRNGRTSESENAVALVLGDIHSAPPIVRIHSQCTTGDVFHSLRCDCHDQLHLALETIAKAGTGVLVYEHQEGRGIGLMEKLRAYALQDQGLDTIEANLRLGHPVDNRDYRLAVSVLQHLGLKSIRLMTNNPDKIAAVQEAGLQLADRVSADVASTPYSAHYLEIKRDKLGHMREADTAVPVPL